MSLLKLLSVSLLLLIIEARFGQENPPAINKIRDCNGGGGGTVNGQLAALAGSAISTLLGAADPCAQQDKADEIIDFARQNNLPQACVAAAVELRRAERNVNPFVRTNPCSDICARLPRNQQLRGSVQAFDPACNLDAFFAANPAQKANFDRQRGASTGGGNQAAPPKVTVATAPKTTAPQATTLPRCDGNLQRFNGALGGFRAPAVNRVGNQFQVQGNAMFKQLSSALGRSCVVQHNKCADAANASGNRNGFTVGACDQQQGQCDQFQRA